MFVVGFVAAMLALGSVISGALATESRALERFGLAYGIGTGSFTFCVFIASLSGIPPSSLTLRVS